MKDEKGQAEAKKDNVIELGGSNNNSKNKESKDSNQFMENACTMQKYSEEATATDTKKYGPSLTVQETQKLKETATNITSLTHQPGESKKDYFGTKIDKAKRQHHITFRDIVSGQQIADVKEVESYKEFNMLAEAESPQCSCLLL